MLEDTTPRTNGISRPNTYNARERPPRTTTVSIVGTLARLLVIAIPKPRAKTSMKTETIAETNGEYRAPPVGTNSTRNDSSVSKSLSSIVTISKIIHLRCLASMSSAATPPRPCRAVERICTSNSTLVYNHHHLVG